jgi:hypothetical protein
MTLKQIKLVEKNDHSFLSLMTKMRKSFDLCVLGVGLERAPAASLKAVWGIARPHTQYYLTGMLPPKEGLFTVKSWSRFGR